MLTHDEIDEFYKRVDSLNLRFPVAAITEATGESKANVSRILNRKLLPSDSFLKRFNEKFPGGSKNVPRDTSAKPGSKETKEPTTGSISMEALVKLADSNAMLSESNLSLARSHEKLVLMLEEKHTPANGTNYQTELMHQKQVSLILKALAAVGTGKKWKSIEEAYEELNIILADPLGEKSKAGSRAGAHK